MLMTTISIVVIIIISLLLPSITEDVGDCTSQRSINAYFMYYSKFHQEVNAFIKALMVAYENLKTKEKTSR